MNHTPSDYIDEDNLQKSKQLSPSKLQTNRPPQLNIQHSIQVSQKWIQCKITGKNLSIRSYASCCTYNKKLYIYGGYQMLNGSLDDFYYIDLKTDRFQWKVIKAKNGITPGKRTKHAMVAGKQSIYLIGGIFNDAKSTNHIYQYNIAKGEWMRLKPQGIENLPRIDSFGCAILQKEGEQTIYIVGGYNQQKAQMSNAVYEYIPSKNKLTVIFSNNKTNKTIMHPRSGLAMTSDLKNLYIFGGQNQDQRFNDMWLFNLTSLSYQLLPSSGSIPSIRNGHTMNYYVDKLYVFGGIHDITWELDDLYIYHLVKGNWTVLERDSPRKVQKKMHNQDKLEKSKEKIKKKNWYETMAGGIGVNKSLTTNTGTHYQNNNKITNHKQQQKNQSPNKMIDQQRKKAFFHKKAQMLRTFQIPQTQKTRYLNLQTTSQAMRNSLDVIGNIDQKTHSKLTQFGKETHSKFLQPLQNNVNIVLGKKPCARDGHCSVMIDDQLVIFGGDRHQMSFNDVYKLNFTIAHKQTKYE